MLHPKRKPRELTNQNVEIEYITAHPTALDLGRGFLRARTSAKITLHSTATEVVFGSLKPGTGYAMPQSSEFELFSSVTQR